MKKSKKVVSDYKCTLTQHQVTFDQNCLDESFGGTAEKFVITASDLGMVQNHQKRIDDFTIKMVINLNHNKNFHRLSQALIHNVKHKATI